jgi:hypothetical protein
MTPDTTTTREYQVRYPGGDRAPEDIAGTVAEARHLSERWPGTKVYARDVRSDGSATAWAEVVEAKEANHG